MVPVQQAWDSRRHIIEILRLEERSRGVLAATERQKGRQLAVGRETHLTSVAVTSRVLTNGKDRHEQCGPDVGRSNTQAVDEKEDRHRRMVVVQTERRTRHMPCSIAQTRSTQGADAG